MLGWHLLNGTTEIARAGPSKLPNTATDWVEGERKSILVQEYKGMLIPCNLQNIEFREQEVFRNSLSVYYQQLVSQP